ncbi:gliding motility-associated C-terminal domain-containing protein [Winogradskyella sp.]|uniref:T9SS type B sorting domain-containing protein n=1 Tax=Winogradskyella sp. TaxID=1883156 RepID=UPI0025E49E9B|nr:gliding motility-associated C-terminal domain-containing protein [Winogradskyella sp.]
MCLFALAMQGHLDAQIVIGTPNLGFSQACASESFNTYSTTFVFSPESEVNASNQFIIELSDADGDFSNPAVVYTSASGTVTTSPATLDFSLPDTTAGENYKIRIKSNAPIATSTASASFAAYYKLQDSPFTINNLVSTGAYCTGDSYLLAIDNPGTGNNDSPLLYPSLTFNWYKETSSTTSVFVAEGPTLSVNIEGTYFVETNYGSCTSDSFSNRVMITEATSGEADVTIASSLGNPYCPEQGLTTLSTIGGNSYLWFKDGVIIPEATSQMYQTNKSGSFSVQVDLGDCSASGSIDLVSELFDSSINVDEVNTIEDGDTLMVTVTTAANNPEFEWYFNNVLVSGESTDNYEISEFGDYKVVITETTGCTASKEYEFVLQEQFDPFPDVLKIPNVISPNGDGVNDTWIIPQQYVTGTNTEVQILNDRGQVIFQTINYQNNWPEQQLDLTSVNTLYYYIITTADLETKQGSITIVK